MAGRYPPIPGASPQLMDLLSKMFLGSCGPYPDRFFFFFGGGEF